MRGGQLSPGCLLRVVDTHQVIEQAVRHQLSRLAVAGMIDHFLPQGEGHAGRLCGLDPAPGMLNQARVRSDIEWMLGDLSSARWDGEFDLVVMTGHAFQELITDEEIRVALAAIRAALTDHGRFAFETRNRLTRGWQRWATQYAAEVTDSTGARVRRESHVEMPVVGEIVQSTSTFTSPGWEGPEVSDSVLRFLDAGALSRFLSDAGLVIEEQFGDWNRQPLTDESPEIITIVRKGFG